MKTFDNDCRLGSSVSETPPRYGVIFFFLIFLKEKGRNGPFDQFFDHFWPLFWSKINKIIDSKKKNFNPLTYFDMGLTRGRWVHRISHLKKTPQKKYHAVARWGLANARPYYIQGPHTKQGPFRNPFSIAKNFYQIIEQITKVLFYIDDFLKIQIFFNKNDLRST